MSLAVAAIVISLLARNQWFFYDEWAFLVPDLVGPMESHNGHWSLVPFVVTRAIESVVGLNAYWPYYAAALVAHLAVAHLIWRIIRRTGSDLWVATLVVTVLIFLGAGSENILWEFQLGYLGAIAFALGAVVLILRERMTAITIAASAILLLLGLASAGTAVPVAVVAAFVSLRRHGLRQTLAVFAPPAVIYLCWYVLDPNDEPSTYGASGLVDILVTLPEYIGHMFVDGFQKFVPLTGFGAVLVAALVVWLAFHWRDATSRPLVAAYALFAGAVLFATLTGMSRLGFGAETASSSRYIYVIFALSAPLMALAVTGITRQNRNAIVAACILLAGTATFNLGTLVEGADSEGAREQQSRGQIYAALDYVLANPTAVDDEESPEPKWAPNLDVGGLIKLHDLGWIEVGKYSAADKLSALTQLAIEVTATSDVGICSPLAATAAGIPAGQIIVLETPVAADLQIVTIGSTTVGVPRSQTVQPGGFTVKNETGRQIQVSELPSDTKVCSG